MFDEKTSAELPEHEEWIHNTAIPLLERRYGLKTTIVQSEKNYCGCFYNVVKKNTKNKGRMWGFPFQKYPWCNALKRDSIKIYENEIGNHKSIVGIAVDEDERVEKAKAKGQILPLVDYNITESQAFEIAKKNDFLSPAYSNGRTRLGCWFCHNQRLSELRRLRKEHPELWDKLLVLDAVSPVTFKPDATLRYLDERFYNEESQIGLMD